MPDIDWSTLFSWFLPYVLFPFISAAGGYLIQRQRDTTAWNREKEKLQQEYQHKVMLQNQEHQHNIELFRHQAAYELRKQQELKLRSEILPIIWNKTKNSFEKILCLVNPMNQVQVSSGQKTNSAMINDANQSYLEFHDYWFTNVFIIDGQLYSLLNQIDVCMTRTILDAVVAINQGKTDQLQSIYNNLQAKATMPIAQTEQYIRQYLNS